jgi:hypothetical protein
MANWKGFERKQSKPNGRTILDFAWRDQGKDEELSQDS